MPARSAACLEAHIEIEIWPLVFSLLHTLSWGQKVPWCKSNEEFCIMKEGTRLGEGGTVVCKIWSFIMAKWGFKMNLHRQLNIFICPNSHLWNYCQSKCCQNLINFWIYLENSGEIEGLHCNRNYVITQFLSFGDQSPRRKGKKEVYGSWNYLPGFMELDLETRSQISHFRFLIALLWKS